MKIVIIGPPGSGKTTQAKLLAQKLGLFHFSLGEALRQLSRKRTARAKKIKKLLEAGRLVDNSISLAIVNDFLKTKNAFVIDGFPRNLWQAKQFKRKLDRVFYLVVSDQENLKRLVKRGRKDDQPAVIKKRLQIYHRETEPVLEFYRQKGILKEIDGERPIEAIHQEILAQLPPCSHAPVHGSKDF